MRTVVDSHKHELQMMRDHHGSVPSGAFRSASGSRATNSSRRFESDRKTRSKTAALNGEDWNYTASKSTLNALIAAQTDKFELDLGAVRPMTGYSQRHRLSRSGKTHARHDIPAWELSCKVEIQIDEMADQIVVGDEAPDHGPMEKFTCARKEVHEANLRGFISSHANETRIHIDMDEPVKFSLAPLIVRSKSNNENGTLDQPNLWKMDISISFEDEVSSKFALEHICREASLQYQPFEESMGGHDASADSNFLIVRWTGAFTDLGPKTHVLELRHCKNMQVALLGCGLEVNTRLSPPIAASPLGHHNSMKRKLSHRDLPGTMPPANSSKIEPRENIRVIYILKSRDTEHEIQFEDYICPLCNKTNFHSFDLLHLHLHHNHTLCRFKVNRDEDRIGRVPVTTISIGIQIARSDLPTTRRKDRDSDWDQFTPLLEPQKWRKSSDDELAWFAPNTPFDIDQFHNGDETWFQHGHSPSTRPLPQPQFLSRSPLRSGTRHSLPNPRTASTPATAATTMATTTRSPSRVPTIPPRRRKRFKVPPAPPGLSFFRTATKHPLHTGDLASESDDSGPDDAWTLRKSHAALFSATAPGLPREVRACIALFDAHLRAERLAGDVHVGDAVVRFLRAKRPVLARWPALAQEVRRKVGELWADRIVGDGVREFCEGVVGEVAAAARKGVGRTGTPRQKGRGSIGGGGGSDGGTPRTRAAMRRRMRRAARVVDEDEEGEGEESGSVAEGGRDGDGDVEMGEGSPMGDTIVVQPGELDEETVTLLNSGEAKAVQSMGRCTCGKPVDALRYAICCANVVSFAALRICQAYSNGSC
ncbi:MAG: hypothetical protein M1821_002717 [Bathelium mastoideum]|nr:MAG: hypothetical protein M1821_002717 [Bathelium mastoideum]